MSNGGAEPLRYPSHTVGHHISSSPPPPPLPNPALACTPTTFACLPASRPDFLLSTELCLEARLAAQRPGPDAAAQWLAGMSKGHLWLLRHVGGSAGGGAGGGAHDDPPLRLPLPLPLPLGWDPLPGVLPKAPAPTAPIEVLSTVVAAVRAPFAAPFALLGWALRRSLLLLFRLGLLLSTLHLLQSPVVPSEAARAPCVHHVAQILLH